MKIDCVPTGMPIKSNLRKIEYWEQLPEIPQPELPQPDEEVVSAVRRSVRKLSSIERDVVERFHFYGQSCDEIGAALRISPARTYSVLKQARRKLKSLLSPFVRERYGTPGPSGRCPVCRSPDRKAIEKLLKTKTREETWKRILSRLKTDFHLQASPRGLKCHQREH